MARFTFSLLAVLLAVAILPSALSQYDKTRKGGGKINGSGEEEEDEDRCWLFHFGPTDSREEYLDPMTGEVKGYHIDVLNAVCAIAEKDCKVVYDLSKNCFDNVDGVAVGGVGLHNFYYDACTAWFKTYTRARTFDFSKSFNQNQGAGFAVRAGKRGFDPTDLTGETIGFITGFFADPGCIARQGEEIIGSDLGADQIMFFPGIVDLKEALLDDVIDAAFDWGSNYNNDDDFEFLNEESPIECAICGPALMFRKDNPIDEWFNDALCTLLGTPQYQQICDDIETVHGHKAGPTCEQVFVDYADICGGDLCCGNEEMETTTEEAP